MLYASKHAPLRCTYVFFHFVQQKMAMLAGMQEILINFDEKALDKLRNEFEDLGLSLDFSQFVTCMRKMLPELCARDKGEISNLIAHSCV